MTTKLAFTVSDLSEVMAVFEQSYVCLTQHTLKKKLPQAMVADLKMAFVEGVANAVKHAGEIKNRGAVKGVWWLSAKSIGFEIYDHGKGFALNRIKPPNPNKLSVSGRGILLLKQVGDGLVYRCGKTRNVLRFTRSLVPHPGAAGLELISEISGDILRQAPLEEIASGLLTRVAELFAVERASLLVYDESLDRLKLVAAKGIKTDKPVLLRPGEGVSGYVFQHGKSLLITDTAKSLHRTKGRRRYKGRSFLSVPLPPLPGQADGRPFGVINLTDRRDGKSFSKKDLALLGVMAGQAAIALYVRALLAQAALDEALRRDVQTVREIQLSFLPSTAPQVPGWDVAGRCEMAASAGGDYVDFIAKGYWLYVVVADVSGHNLGSAMTMANFRSQLRAVLNFESEPGQILAWLNHSLYEDLQVASHFVSCLLLRIDTQMNRVEVANAGHYPPVFFSGLPFMDEAGLVLGIEPDSLYRVMKAKLSVGDGLVLFTDGVIEAMNNEGSIFGLPRLISEVGDGKKSAQVIVDRLVKKAMAFRGNLRPPDDMTVAVIKPLA